MRTADPTFNAAVLLPLRDAARTTLTSSATLQESDMPRGDKSSYSDKQKRQTGKNRITEKLPGLAPANRGNHLRNMNPNLGPLGCGKRANGNTAIS